MRDFIYVVADSSIEKLGEDKHSFLVDDLFAAGADAGFEYMRLYRNAHFGCFTHGEAIEVRPYPLSLLGYLSAFLCDHHGLSVEGLALLKATLFPAFSRLDTLFSKGDGPALVGVMAFRA